MNGILLVDKPQEWTSSDVVCKLRGVLHQKRIGHSGTLDPMATGLLPLFLGRSTKAVEFAENHNKVYVAGIRLGIETDTQDIWGKVVEERFSDISTDDFLRACQTFIGEIEQIPPMYSAIKINGQRLYELARRGKEICRQPRKIHIYSINLLDRVKNDFYIQIHCSKGTYIRTLCHDIGSRLGTGACMFSLKRTECGPFNINQAVSLERLIMMDIPEVEACLRPVDCLFQQYPAYVVEEKMMKSIKCGQTIHADLADGFYRVYSPDGQFLMLGNVVASQMCSRKNFFEV